VILAGIGLFLHTLFNGILHITDDLTQIVVPGAKDLTLKPKLMYTVYLEEHSFVDGRIYSTTESVSGLTCVVTSETSGNKIKTFHPRGSMTYDVGGRSGRSVLVFVTEEAGVYRIACDYEEGKEGPKAVLAVGSGMTQRIFSTIIKSLASMLGGMTLGAAVIVAVIVLRERAKKQLAQAGQTPL
jgi:hypothetical protein